MSNGDNNLYEFGRFRLNGETRTLWCGDDLISLSPKALELLFLLVEHRGGIVSKQEIFNKVWSDTFVEDGVLTQNIYTLRQTLGTDAGGKQLIETLARRGYRFAAPIKIVNAAEVTTENRQPPDVFYKNTPTDFSVAPLENVSPDSSPLHRTNGGSKPVSEARRFISSPATVKEKRLPKARRRALFIGLGVLIASALGFGIYQIAVQRLENKQSNVAPIERIRQQRITDTGDVVFPTVSPNGEMLAFVRLGEREQSVWFQQIATGAATQILPPSVRGYRSLAFSPDGNYLFFRETDGETIFQTPILGGAPKKIAEKIESEFSVSPNGRQFAFFRNEPQRDSSALILASVEGGEERILGVRPIAGGYRSGAPAWSADGSKIVVAVSSEKEPRPLLLAVDAATGQETELKTPRWQAILHYLWMPDGGRLIVVARAAGEPSSQIWLYNFPDGEARRLTNDTENYFWLSLSADGRKLVARQQQIVSHLWLLPDGELQKARRLTDGTRARDGFRGLLWMPGGKLVFTSIEGSIAHLHSINADSSNRIQLTANVAADNTYPSTSADGRVITFTSHRTKARQIWRMDADGRNQKQLTFGEEPKETAFASAVSPDGAEVFFIRRAGEPSSIWKTSIEGGAMQPVSNLKNATAEDFLSISPDGKWLAYRHAAGDEKRDENASQKVGILATSGEGEPKLFDLPLSRPYIRWSKDSAAIYFIGGASNASTIWRQPVTGGDPQKLIDFPDRVFNFAWSADGVNLVVARGKLSGDAILMTNLP